ncbi:MAG: alpha/beta fold hydrolase [Candidatus Thorarchaeota archaeon]
MKDDEGHYVEVNGLRMFYLDTGKGMPLVLLHGGIATAHFQWGPSIPIFSKEFRVIAPDCRGQGKTNNPDGTFSYSQMADDIAGLINDLDLENPFVCGWSDGGQIALEIGIRHPDIARAIVAGGVLAELSEYYLDFMRSMGVKGPGDFDFELFSKKYPDFLAAASEIHSPVYGPDYWKELFVNISKMWTNPQEFPGNRISKITTPTLVLQADRDEAISLEEAIKIYRAIPGAELAVVPGSDHTAMMTKPDAFCSAITEFLLRY